MFKLMGKKIMTLLRKFFLLNWAYVCGKYQISLAGLFDCMGESFRINPEFRILRLNFHNFPNLVF